MNGPPFYEAVDADNEPTIWRRVEDWRQCIPVARRCDVSADAWELLMAGVLQANRWARR